MAQLFAFTFFTSNKDDSKGNYCGYRLYMHQQKMVATVTVVTFLVNLLSRWRWQYPIPGLFWLPAVPASMADRLDDRVKPSIEFLVRMLETKLRRGIRVGMEGYGKISVAGLCLAWHLDSEVFFWVCFLHYALICQDNCSDRLSLKETHEFLFPQL